jgi:long-chain fatty acid transport protein
MTSRKIVAASALGAALGALSLPGTARAGGLDVPDAGAEQLGRGSASVASVTDPLAAFQNPAAMSFQSNGVSLNLHLMFQHECFDRKGPGGTNVSPGAGLPGPGDAGGPAASVCSSSAFPNPQIAAVFKPTERLAIGIAVLGPHAVGSSSWPESLDYTRNGNARSEPSPTRYMLVDKTALLLFPTVSVSYAITPEFSLGAGFVWGIGSADESVYTEALSPSAHDDFFAHQDVKAHVKAHDFFIPGFVVGANWKASKRVDIGAWYHYSDSLRADVDLDLTSQNWRQNGAPNDKPCPAADPKCNITVAKQGGALKFAIPMEAKLGVRYHHPLATPAAPPSWAKNKPSLRDPLSQDRFDISADFTWANTSAVDSITIRFGPEACRFDPACTDSQIPVKGTPGKVPVNGDVPHQWRDVLGVRVGTDVTVLPNRLALRGGGFFESKGVDDKYLNIDFHMGWKLGLALGGTVRVGPVDMHLAYQHVFYGTLDNGGNGAVKALSGDASSGYRSLQTVNGGKLTSSLNELALGGSVHF